MGTLANNENPNETAYHRRSTGSALFAMIVTVQIRKPRVLSPLRSVPYEHVRKEVDLVPLACEDGDIYT